MRLTICNPSSIALLWALVAGGCAAAHPQQRFEFTQLCMGVQARVTVYAGDEATARAAGRAAFDRIAHLDAVMSDYRPDSELMRLCDRAGRGPVAVSDDLFRVLARAEEIARATDGAFDATVGPAVGLWRLSRRAGRLPDAVELDRAKALIGWQGVTLDRAARTVELRTAGMRLDLGGIGKGYAAGEAVRAIEAVGVRRCLVAIAGDIAAGDPPPGRAGWTISAHTGAPGHEIELQLTRGSVSTSGDTEQFVEIGGVRYSHIVDPRTGLGLTNLTSAAVVAPDGATADALSTALCVLGVERAVEVVARFPGVRAFIERRTAAGVEMFEVSGPRVEGGAR